MKVCNVGNDRYFNLTPEELVAKYFLFETAGDMEICEPFEYQGKFYSGSCKMPKDKIIVVREFKPLNGEELCAENQITCPYCNAQNCDSWERSGDSEDEEFCDSCGSTYGWERSVSVSYNCVPVKRGNIKVINGAVNQ